MKKILMLGGSHFQVPAIIYAKKAGYHVITADYLPDNPGHKYADEYHNVSTIDEKKVLQLAEKLRIDGIVSYASDPGAPSAAYVAEKLSLPGNPYESVRILQRKDLFRGFLKSNDFMVPETASFRDLNEAKEFAASRLEQKAIVVKPADSSGSKGVTKLLTIDDFDHSFQNALNYSIAKIVVVEDFIEKAIYEMDGDGFVWNGKLVFRCFGNQHNDLECNPYVPMGISFPYIQEKAIQQKAHEIIDSILTKLNMKVGGLNIEYLTDKDGNIYILEIGPRSGGNLIPEVIKLSTGVDLIAYSIEGAMGKDCTDLRMTETNGFYSSYILHAKRDGKVKSINIDAEIKHKIVQQNIFTKAGDAVKKFDGSNNTLGTFILKFENQDEMIYYLDKMTDYISVELF
ncbi:MAG: carbamoyl-phosphate-synthetase [Bacteroidetes bacterium HGW-Bacteroidetes-1]|jgi:biotin carboxylase|nr:MAG: carbamoyl-phosphate-synthetase [Bacteroidetes bacterium HGW-Bacteroidetes-1]